MRRVVRTPDSPDWDERSCPNGSATYFNPGKGEERVFMGWIVAAARNGAPAYDVYVRLGDPGRPVMVGSVKTDSEARTMLREWLARRNPVYRKFG